MDFQNINWEQVTNRAIGATGAVFVISIAERELPKMNTKDAAGKETMSPLYEYRHYAYALVGAILPEIMPATKNKDDFATKYASGIKAFSDAMLFYGASQILEKQLPEQVRIDGVPQSFANYVLGADANTAYGMQNYVLGTEEQVMLIERETGEQVYIDPNGNYVKKAALDAPAQWEKPMPLYGKNPIMSDVMLEDVQSKYCVY